MKTSHRASLPRRAARAAFLLGLAAALGALSACGSRVYSATVSGYVRSAAVNADGTQDGINGAEVLIYTADPATDTAVEPLARTSSMTSGGNDGYWSHKIMWTTSSPLYGDEGDSGTVWVKIMRKGYFPRTAEVPGILSDASNVVPTIELTAIHAAEVKGKVVNENGVGVNGVNVVLDLMSTTDDQADYTATTATTDGELGVFTFTDIAWGDADSVPAKAIAADGSATETCKLYVDDTAYYSDEYNEKGRESQTAFTVTSDAKLDLRSTKPITARSTTFTVPIVKGRVVDASGNGVNGVTMAVDLPITTNANPDATVTTATLGGQTGWYQFENVSWTNANPTHSGTGLYDDKVAANVYLRDGTRYSENDADKPVAVTVTSGQACTVTANITVASAEFTLSTVTGRVVLKDSASTASPVGKNGVVVYLELSDGSTLNTTSTTVSGVDGIFQFKSVQWTDTEPESSTGVVDSEQVRLYVQDDNYTSDNDSASPLIATLSDTGASGDSLDLTTDAANSLLVVVRNFTCPSVTGKVTTSGGAGIPGLSVVLDLQSTTNTTQDYTATTDKDGVFTFNTVEWTDETPDVSSSSDSEDVQISINDADYSTTTALPLKTITSDTAAGDATAAWTIIAARKTRLEYSVTVTGTCTYRKNKTDGSGYQESTVGGVDVSITTTEDYSSGSATGLQTNAVSCAENSADDGTYSITITWSRKPDYVPSSDAAKTAGGDTLAVNVVFTGGAYNWNVTKAFTIKSWSNNNIVDCVVTE